MMLVYLGLYLYLFVILFLFIIIFASVKVRLYCSELLVPLEGLLGAHSSSLHSFHVLKNLIHSVLLRVLDPQFQISKMMKPRPKLGRFGGEATAGIHI